MSEYIGRSSVHHLGRSFTSRGMQTGVIAELSPMNPLKPLIRLRTSEVAQVDFKRPIYSFSLVVSLRVVRWAVIETSSLQVEELLLKNT